MFLLRFLGLEHLIKSNPHAIIMLAEGGLDGIAHGLESGLARVAAQKVGKDGLQAQDGRSIGLRAEETPVDGFLQDGGPLVEGEVGKDGLLLEVLGVIMKPTCIEYTSEGCETGEEGLCVGGEVAMGVFDAAQDAFCFVCFNNLLSGK